MITIKQATKEDVLGIQKVIYETWLVTYPNKEAGITLEDIKERFKDRFSKEVVRKRTESILNMTENELFLITKDKDEVIGICRVEKKEAHNELLAIYVLPNYQGKGIGIMLWKESKKFLGDSKDTIVNVAVYNAQAIKFYKKLGFVETGKYFTEEHFRMPISGVAIPEMELVLKSEK